ncbi:MAG: sugar ABC transporter permease [Streptococcaceae bacterium]|jgi:arabinogalactan oligomer/maltooligosaccharide transport system permease protein|nr:sugar ABC transporter permease [Streptococcaceae bacterium]
MKSYKRQRQLSLVGRYILLAVLALIWIAPVCWIVLASFNDTSTGFISTFWPQNWTLQNYVKIFNNPIFPYGNWLLNTFVIALVVTVVNTLITTVMSFVLSRLRFKLRKPFLQFALIIGMFPGIMAMMALYYILNSFHMTNLVGLTLVYVGGSGLGFYIFKGFLDTIPVSIDEAAVIDGATKWQVFTHITLPLSRPMIVYTSLTAFMGPWLDFLFASVILGNGSPNQRTIAYGLYNMMTTSRGSAAANFPQFIAGCVIIAVPITVLFIIMQKFYVSGITAGADKG